MKKLLWRSFFAGLFLFLNTSLSFAISLGFSPNPQTVSVGDSFEIDVVISDLGDEIVSAFDLDVVYDQTILKPTVVIFGPLLGNPDIFEALTVVDLSSPGIIDFAELSFFSDVELLSQPETFSLATFSFVALSAGTSSLVFSPDPIFGIDIKGLTAEILPINVAAGTIGVEAAVAPIPEPGTASLVFLGVMVLSLRLRKSFSNNY